MIGVVVQDVHCPKCGIKKGDVICWEHEFRGENGCLTFYYYECKSCKHRWLTPENTIHNFLEIFRVLGLKGVPEEIWV